MSKVKFPLGQVVATPGAIRVMEKAGQDANHFLNLHVTGNWGELDAEDRQANDRALVQGGRIMSAYVTKDGTKLWVITEADRSVTTILLPEDY